MDVLYRVSTLYYATKSVECLPTIDLGYKMSLYEVALAYLTDPGPQSKMI